MEARYLRTGGLTSYFVYNVIDGTTLDDIITCPEEIKMTPSNIDQYSKQFNWIKDCIMYDKIKLAVIGTDDLSFYESWINKYEYEYGYSTSVCSKILNWKYKLFVFEEPTRHFFKQMFLEYHSRSLIRTVDNKSILIKYVDHYFNLFKKQWMDGSYMSNEFHVISPVVD